MRFRPSSVGWGFLAFVIGALPAFVLAGPALFADGPMGERLFALAAYAAAVLVLAIGGGIFAPTHRLAVSIGMASPVVAVLLLVEWGQTWIVVLAAAFLGTSAVMAWVGTEVGSRIAAAVMARKAAQNR